MFLVLAGLGCSGAPVARDDAQDTSVTPDSAENVGETSETGEATGTGTVDDTGDTLPRVTPGIAGLSDLGVRNIVVVHVDTLRRDRLPPYGGEHDTLPLSGGPPWLVVRGMVSSTSWTMPSTTSLLTGLSIAHHGVTHTLSSGALNRSLTAPTVAPTLADAGYASLALPGNEALSLLPGIFDGFDEVEEGARQLGLEVSGALTWIDTLPAGQPFFLFLQPMNVHGPYSPDEDHLGTWSDPSALPFDTSDTEEGQVAAFQDAYAAAATDDERAAVVAQLRAIYDEDILGIDEGIHKLQVGLAERGLDRDTLLVLVADHGETLGEELNVAGRPYFGHGGKTRPELVQVPLMFSHPNLPPAVVDCLSENVDVVPTLLDALGLPPMDGVDGRPLQDGCRAIAGASAFLNDRDTDDLGEISVTDGTSMLRWNCFSHSEWRYDLVSDPTALRSVAIEAFPQRDALLAEMNTFMDGMSDGLGELSCEVEP